MSVDEERCELEFSVMQRHVRGLELLVKKVHERFLDYKQQKNVVDFSDLEQFTYQILQDKHQRKALQVQFDHLFIDECQDASADVLFVFYNAVLNTNSELYLLGDKMQEIYNNYDGSFDTNLKLFDTSLSLRKNHRCSENIVTVLNKIYNDNDCNHNSYINYNV